MIKKIFIALAFLVLAVLPVNVFGIGMMTQPIVINDILRGQETFLKLTLLNSANKEQTYGLKAEGQIEKWISFYEMSDKSLQNPITEVKMPANGFKDVNIKFSAPDDVANGKYTGEILAFLSSAGEVKTDETSVNVSQQVARKVTITVTDKEIINLEASVIPIDYGIKSGQPLKIRINYYNKGNVAMRPDAQLTIKKDGTAIFNAIFTYPEQEESIKIKERKDLSYVEWSTSGQANGKYTAEIKILNKGDVLKENRFNFSIGYFENNIWVSALSFLSGGLGTRWLALGVILLIAAVLFEAVRKRFMRA